MGKRTQLRKEVIAISESKASKSRILLILFTSIVAMAVTTLVLSAGKDQDTSSGNKPSGGQTQQMTALQLVESLIAQPDLAENTDIALLNLAVAPGLAPSDRARVIGESLNTLDEWAKAIAAETYSNRHHYQKNPTEFGNEAGWKMAMMCSVLGKDFKVRYDPSLTSADRQNTSNDKFYANPDAIFLTGCWVIRESALAPLFLSSTSPLAGEWVTRCIL